jgi:hypothetical protein
VAVSSSWLGHRRRMGDNGTLNLSAEVASRPSSRWSLKRQIRALGVLFLMTILLACGFAVELVRNSDAARIADAQRQLEQAAAQLQAHYVAEAFKQRHVAGPDTPADGHLLASITARLPFLQVCRGSRAASILAATNSCLATGIRPTKGRDRRPIFPRRSGRQSSRSRNRPSTLAVRHVRESIPPTIRCCSEQFRYREAAQRVGRFG